MGRRSGKRRVPGGRRAEDVEESAGQARSRPALPAQQPGNAPSRSDAAPPSVAVPVPVLDRARVTAAYSRSPVSHRAPTGTAPRPRVEMSVNELTGTMSWRTVQPPESDASARPGDWNARNRTAAPGSRMPNSEGAAPIPTNPADVRAAVNVSVASLPPEQLRRHLAVVAALRSHVAADLAVGGKLPPAVAAHLRTGPAPAAAHALNEERVETIRELTRRPPAARRTATPAPTRAHHR
ncbi:hypothetical protein ACIRQH_36190 [Streptomyces sp. NPDC102279]|uniref:hypothetical protein n=1 Tax=Streptomyces sp. NPDC102279 TaxID=3366153 RepID=UPI0037F5CB29